MFRWPVQVSQSALLVAGVACLIQLAYLADSHGDPTFDVPIVDAGVYHESACRFAAGGLLVDDAFWQPPLFPTLLGTLYRVTGPNVLVARLVLAVLAVVSCLLLYRIGCRLFGGSVGLLAGLMLAGYGPFVFLAPNCWRRASACSCACWRCYCCCGRWSGPDDGGDGWHLAWVPGWRCSTCPRTEPVRCRWYSGTVEPRMVREPRGAVVLC